MATLIKFLKHCVTNGTVRARVHYSVDNRVDGRKCVTIYSKDYSDALPKVLADVAEYVNNTDSMTDYFDKGRAVIFEGSPLYAAARQRAERNVIEQRAHYARVQARREEKRAALYGRPAPVAVKPEALRAYSAQVGAQIAAEAVEVMQDVQAMIEAIELQGDTVTTRIISADNVIDARARFAKVRS